MQPPGRAEAAFWAEGEGLLQVARAPFPVLCQDPGLGSACDTDPAGHLLALRLQPCSQCEWQVAPAWACVSMAWAPDPHAPLPPLGLPGEDGGAQRREQRGGSRSSNVRGWRSRAAALRPDSLPGCAKLRSSPSRERRRLGHSFKLSFLDFRMKAQQTAISSREASALREWGVSSGGQRRTGH